MKVYTQLGIEERTKLFELHRQGANLGTIARAMNRNKSTISRELRRNRYSDTIGYLPDTADTKYRNRKYRLKRKLDRSPGLKGMIIEMLKKEWGPDAIAGRLRLEEKGDISTETIYQYIYSDEGKSLGLHQYLLSKNQARNQRHGRKARKVFIPERVSIHERPDAANARQEAGHYEVDLTFCTGNQSTNIMTITERVSRYTIIVKNASKNALEVGKQLFNALAELPKGVVKSLTFDNGMEFVKHIFVRNFFGIKTYFCDPHSPWQKGQVEKTNAMLHRFIPKKSDLLTFDGNSLKDIQNKFNNVPRKILGYRTPNELFTEDLQGVALHS